MAVWMETPNLFCPSVLLFLEQLSKVAQGSSCKRTNLPLKSGPWGNSGTLLINSEPLSQPACPALCGGMRRCTSRHTSASRLGCPDRLTSHFIGKWRGTAGTWHLKGWLVPWQADWVFFRRQLLHWSWVDERPKLFTGGLKAWTWQGDACSVLFYILEPNRR